jgi:NADPH:quinone reductase-like Zn-dependent oxidoreductase
MGSLAISYAIHAGYTVITTCSAHNIPLLKSLGADHVFDRSDKRTVQKIKELEDIEYIF